MKLGDLGAAIESFDKSLMEHRDPQAPPSSEIPPLPSPPLRSPPLHNPRRLLAGDWWFPL